MIARLDKEFGFSLWTFWARKMMTRVGQENMKLSQIVRTHEI